MSAGNYIRKTQISRTEHVKNALDLLTRKNYVPSIVSDLTNSLAKARKTHKPIEITPELAKAVIDATYEILTAYRMQNNYNCLYPDTASLAQKIINAIDCA